MPVTSKCRNNPSVDLQQFTTPRYYHMSFRPLVSMASDPPLRLGALQSRTKTIAFKVRAQWMYLYRAIDSAGAGSRKRGTKPGAGVPGSRSHRHRHSFPSEPRLAKTAKMQQIMRIGRRGTTRANPVCEIIGHNRDRAAPSSTEFDGWYGPEARRTKGIDSAPGNRQRTNAT